jgi:hemerythrin
MRTIEWKESYSVGVGFLDEEHKKLFDMLNKITALFSEQDPKEQVGGVLSDFELYASVHFKSEEDLFTKYSYHKTEEHNKEHRFYEEKVNEFRRKYDAADINVKVEMIEFLADWIMGHTQGIDKEYRNFFNNRGIF